MLVVTDDPDSCSPENSDGDLLPSFTCLSWAAIVLSVLPQANRDPGLSLSSWKYSQVQALDFYPDLEETKGNYVEKKTHLYAEGIMFLESRGHALLGDLDRPSLSLDLT